MAVPTAESVPGRGVLDLPRARAGARPQHLLVTILGDYWFGCTAHLPSAALVDLLAEFDVTPLGARAALSRLARRGLLESSRSGRRTFYGLTPAATVRLGAGLTRILAFGAPATTWDGRWTVALFSVPEQQRDLRHALRGRLRWLGLAPLYDGVWISPHPVADATVAVLDELGVRSATVFRGEWVPAGPAGGDPATAWDLTALGGVYQRLIDEYRPLAWRARAGVIGTAEALVARTAVMDAWRTLPNLDPQLPGELLATDWPRDEARALFVELYDGLAPLAEQRVRQLVGRHAPDLARLVRAHGTDGGQAQSGQPQSGQPSNRNPETASISSGTFSNTVR